MTNVRPASVVDTERDLVFEFFAAFARFEFALKRHQAYLENKGYAAANWNAFAVAISNRFSEVHDADFREAVRHLETEPPKQQIVKANALDWRDLKRDGKTTEQFVIECLKTVRNNLFHGGKFPEGRSPTSPETSPC